MAEQHIYDTLWREARMIAEDYREITIGYRALADKARLHRNTIDRNLESLRSKLAIEIIKAEDREENIGRTYRVFGFRNILNRREAAGLVWYMKDRSGVRLLRQVDLGPDTSRVTGPVRSERRSPVTSVRTGPVIPQVPIPLTSEVTPFKEEGIGSGTSATSAVARAVSEELGFTDDAAIRRIVAECLKRAPDASPEEMADLTRMTARRIRNMRNLNNPMGLLIVQVPKYFEGASFQIYRQTERDRKETERRELIRVATEIMADPDMPAESRMWATDTLAAHRSQEEESQCAENISIE